jgi:uncharacterized protein (TIGR00255 family)
MNMTLSMTAFARGDRQTDLGTYSWEIRTVNSRYLELHFRLPDNLKALETALREKLRNSLSRGKVECTLKYIGAESSSDITVNTDMVANLNQAADQVHGVIGPGNALDALEILKWPGVLNTPQLDMAKVSAEALELFDNTLKDLIDMRGREGAALQQFIEQRLESIASEVEKVKAVLPDLLAAQKANLQSRFEDLQVNLDPERLEQEMVIILQKADVDEELDRLQAHLKEVKRILKQSGPVGRRLDFMMQELNREANTLSSKSLSSQTTQNAVELKVLIEQMREQIQNIE